MVEKVENQKNKHMVMFKKRTMIIKPFQNVVFVMIHNLFCEDPVYLGGALQYREGGTRRQQIQESSRYLQSWSIGIISFLLTQPTHNKNYEIIFIFLGWMSFTVV